MFIRCVCATATECVQPYLSTVQRKEDEVGEQKARLELGSNVDAVPRPSESFALCTGELLRADTCSSLILSVHSAAYCWR